MPPTQHWILRTLGKAELCTADQVPVKLPSRKLFELLVYLRSQAHPQERRKLALVLWPNSSPEAALASLRQALSGLRKVLGDSLQIDADSRISISKEQVIWDVESSGSYAGEFLPAYDCDWVLETRSRLQTDKLRQWMDKSRQACQTGMLDEAIEYARKASASDPYAGEPVRWLAELYSKGNEPAKSAQVRDSFDQRIVRELGVFPKSDSEPVPAGAHPLVSTANWLEHHNPPEALEFLCATQQEWSEMAISESVPVFERVLSRTDSSRHWARGKAVLYHLYWVAGRLVPLLPEAEDLLKDRIENEDWEVASRLGSAIAYGNLSKGDPSKALQFAKLATQTAERTQIRELIAEQYQQLGIIYGQVGMPGKSLRVFREIQDQVDESASPTLTATQNLLRVEECASAGKFEVALERLQRGERFVREIRADRKLPWIHLAYATLAQQMHDFTAAIRHLDAIEALGEEVGGQAVTAAMSDQRSKLFCQIGELDAGAEHLLRADRYRQKMGATRSVKERVSIQPTRSLLKQRLRPKDWHIARLRASGQLN